MTTTTGFGFNHDCVSLQQFVPSAHQGATEFKTILSLEQQT